MQKPEPEHPAPFLQDLVTEDAFGDDEQTLRSPEVRRADWYDAKVASSIDSYATLRGFQSGPASMLTDCNEDRTQTEFGPVGSSTNDKVEDKLETSAVICPPPIDSETPPSIMEKILGRKSKVKGKERNRVKRKSSSLDSLRPVIDASRKQGDLEEFILVMGPTGTGKTSFINGVIPSGLRVGHGLQSCTSEVHFSKPLELLGRQIILFDTPGFDDTNRTDVEILAEISLFLGNFYEQKNKLIGVIYLHDISNKRMGGTAIRDVEMFRKAVGTEAAKNVVIVTTKWDLVDATSGDERHAELSKYYKKLLDDGATMQKLTGDQSPLSVVKRIIQRHHRVDLRIQGELVDEHKKIRQTSAGHVLQVDVDQRKKELEDRRMQEMMPLMGYRGISRSPGTNGTPSNAQDEPMAVSQAERGLQEIKAKQEILDKDYEEAKKTRIGRRIIGLVDSVLRRIKFSWWHLFLSGGG